jgi:hypothetical protein
MVNDLLQHYFWHHLWTEPTETPWLETSQRYRRKLTRRWKSYSNSARNFLCSNSNYFVLESFRVHKFAVDCDVASITQRVRWNHTSWVCCQAVRIRHNFVPMSHKPWNFKIFLQIQVRAFVGVAISISFGCWSLFWSQRCRNYWNQNENKSTKKKTCLKVSTTNFSLHFHHFPVDF